ncbi:hypothetical protein EXIGLDRAFT_830009 [Exidia glandulosa HHB12029]|uniref:Uncharacterized protein n=1 Tax=Exidia glandulosa HHB12029 TaxID=1314781 RepID=A0A165P249_EXIGL|nr:hypothetical protein EXIGLDRAFT_830009 [Exidia glandulosa HHB12029]
MLQTMRPALTLMLPTPVSNPTPSRAAAGARRARSPHPHARLAARVRGSSCTPPPMLPQPCGTADGDLDGIGEPMMFEMSPIVATRGIESLAPVASMPVPVPGPLRVPFPPRAPLFAGYDSGLRRQPAVADSPPVDGAQLDAVPALRKSRPATALQPAANIFPRTASITAHYTVPATPTGKPPSFRYNLPAYYRTSVQANSSTMTSAPVPPALATATAGTVFLEDELYEEDEQQAQDVPELVHHAHDCLQCSVSGSHQHHLHANMRRVVSHTSARTLAPPYGLGAGARRRSSTPDAFKLEMLAYQQQEAQLQMTSSSEDDVPITPDHAFPDDTDGEREEDVLSMRRARTHSPQASVTSRGRTRSRRPLARRSLPLSQQMRELVLTSPSSSGGNDGDRDDEFGSDYEHNIRRRSG